MTKALVIIDVQKAMFEDTALQPFDGEAVVVEENVVAWALGTAKVEDQATDFDELMGNTR